MPSLNMEVSPAVEDVGFNKRVVTLCPLHHTPMKRLLSNGGYFHHCSECEYPHRGDIDTYVTAQERWGKRPEVLA